MFQGKNIKPAVFIPPVLFLLSILLFLIIAVHISAHPYMNRSVIDISDKWQYHTDADPMPKPICLPSDTKEIWLNENWYITYTLPDVGPNAAIMFSSDYLKVVAELDGNEIYRYGYEASAIPSPGQKLILIPLPDGYVGKELTLTLQPTLNLWAYSIYMGDGAALLSYAVGYMLPALIMGVAVFLFGITLLYVYFIQRKNGKAAAADFWFGIFVVLVGVFIPNRSFLYLILLDPVAASVLQMLVSFLLPCAVLLFVRAACERFKTLLLIALIIHIAGFLPTALMQLLSPNPPTVLFTVFIYLKQVYYALAVLAFALEIRAGKKDYRRITWAGLLAFAMIIIGTVNNVFVNPLHLKDWELFTKLGLVLFITVEVIGRLCDNFKASAQLLADYQAAQVKNRLALEHFEDVKDHMQKVYRINHDIHHHFGALGHLLEQSDMPRAREYLAKLTRDYPLDRQTIYSKNQLLNYIIGYTVKQAEAKGISFTHTINLPETVGMSDSDFYSLFINIIDNAVEACAAVKDSESRSIELACNMRNGFMHVLCKNSKENDVLFDDGKYVSTKSGDTKRGLGIGIIECIVEKYNGVMDIEYDAGSFTVKLVVKAE